MTPITLDIPVRTVSEANAHAHWRTRQKRARAHIFAACVAVAPRIHGVDLDDGIIVTMTRIAPRALDSDNLVGSQKHIRDGVARAFDVKDNDPRITWVVEQRKGAPKTYGVEIRIEPRTKETASCF